MRLAKYGKKQWLAASVLLVLAAVLSGVLAVFGFLPGACFLLAAALVAWGLFLAFFRDPRRVVSQDMTELVSPADGVIRDIEFIPNDSCEEEVLREQFSGYDILRIGIAQSVFDVHIDRTPCGMTVTKKLAREKSSASSGEKGNKKESGSVLLCGTSSIRDTSFPVALRQISNAGLKRISCAPEEGDCLKKGAKIGMILFGCRTELYLPAKTPVSITGAVGEKVLAGKTVLAVFCGENAREENAHDPHK